MKGNKSEIGAQVCVYSVPLALYSNPCFVGMSRSITDLQATYRWVLTGSVFLNGLVLHLTENVTQNAHC